MSDANDLLGDLGDLATALGVFEGDWFSAPDRYLKTILTDGDQRTGLLAFLGDVIGDERVHTEGTRTTLRIFEKPPVSVALTLDEQDDGGVDLGVAASVDTDPASATGAHVDVHVPVIAIGGSTPGMLPGTARGPISATVQLDLPAGTSTAGVSLTGAALAVMIPTDGAGAPDVSLTLRGLRMPGAAQAADLVLDPADASGIEHALLQLVLSLVQAQAAGLAAADPARALAGMLGLIPGDGVPDFPIADLLAHGPSALASWWAQALQGTAGTAWFGHLATLFGAGAPTTVDGAVGVDLALTTDLALRVAVRVVPGTGGMPRVTPELSLRSTPATALTFALDVAPVSLDLSSGTAVALPQLRVAASVDTTGLVDTDVPLPGGGTVHLKLDGLRTGFALDADRRPTLVLSALGAQVGSSTYDVLDLADADALASVGAHAVEAVAGSLLGALGAAGDLVAALLGPVDGSVDNPLAARLLTDPIGALRDGLQALLAAGSARVIPFLTSLRDAIAAPAVQATGVTGTGTGADPYLVPLTDGVDLAVTVDGTRVQAALAARRTHDLPAATGMRLALDARAALLTADLDPQHPAASFFTALAVALQAEPTGAGPLHLTAGDVTLQAASVGARVLWTPAGGAHVDPWVREPALTLDGTTIDLAALAGAGVLPGAGDLLAPAVDAAHAVWSAALAPALQQLLAAALDRATAALPSDAVTAVRALLGWDGAATVRTLSLSALVDDAQAELRRWASVTIGVDPVQRTVTDAAALTAAVTTLADALGIPLPEAAGLRDAPFAWALPGVQLLAAVAGSDVARLASRVTGTFAGWSPGDPLPGPADVLAGVAADAGVDPLLADVLAGRSPGVDMIEGLVARWTDTDGVLTVAAAAVPAGVAVQRVAHLVHGAPLHGADVQAALTAALGALPAKIVLVGVTAPGEPELLPSAGDAAIATDIDLTAAGVPAASFDLPSAAVNGVTVIRLGGKAACTEATMTGTQGQVARLQRVLAALAPAPGVLVVAGGAAGRIAAAAAAGTAVDRVVTVGAPWSPVSLADVDSGPTAEGVRMLRALAGLIDTGTTLSDDAAHGRALVDALLARDGRGDPLTELSADGLGVPAGAVTALVGQFTEAEVRTAITALVRETLTARTAARAASAVADEAVSALGLRVPLEWGSAPGGLRARLETDLDLAALPAVLTGDAAPPRQITLRLRLWGDGRWLVGGPDPARAAGPRPFALRALTLEATVPLPGSQTAPRGRLVLTEAAIYGVTRTQWVIDLSQTGALLPEVRALLSEVAADLAAQTDAAAGAVRDLLSALGLIDTGGFDATSLTNLLTDPRAVLTTVLADATRATSLAAALRAAAGDTRPDAGTTVQLGPVTADLATRTLQVSAAGAGLTLSGTLGADGGDLALTARIAAGWGVTAGLHVDPGDHALSITAGLAPDAYGDPLPLWPAPADLPARLVALAVDLARDTALRVGADALRTALAAAPTAAGVVDAVLDAARLLAPPAADGSRALVWPRQLIADPRGWLAAATGGVAAAVPALLDAVAAAAGLDAVPGTLTLAPGVRLAASAASGTLHTSLAVDASAFGGTVPAVTVAVQAGVDLPASGAPSLHADLAMGVDAGALAVTVGTDVGGAGVGAAVELRPAHAAVIPLYPHGSLSSVGATAAAATVAALPLLLNALAAHDPAGSPAGALEIAARAVSRVGTALGLATGTPAVFSADALSAFAAAPAGALQAAASHLVGTGLQTLVEAVAGLTDGLAAFHVTQAAGALTLTIGAVPRTAALTWNPAGGVVSVAVGIGDLPGIGAVHASTAVGTTGLQQLDVTVGPIELDLGGIPVRPFARAAWRPAGVIVDVGLSTAGDTRVLAHAAIPGGITVTAESGAIDAATALDAAGLARTAVQLVFEPAVDVVLHLPDVQTLLSRTVPGSATTVGQLLATAGLVTGTGPYALTPVLVDALADPASLLGHLADLVKAAASALPSVSVAGLTVSLATSPALGITIAPAGDGFTLTGDADLRVRLVADADWIGGTPAGITITLADLSHGVQFTPGLVVGGVGVHIDRQSGPLLDAGLRITGVTLLGYAAVTPAGVGGGAKVSLDGIGLDLGGAGANSGGNPVASGVMPAGGDGENAPKPAFSPGLELVKKPASPLSVKVVVGTVAGPWWLTVQRAFGPIYLEQVGLDVRSGQTGIASVSVMVSGTVSLFGFAASVDGLSLTYTTGGSIFDPSQWSADVDGFAISANTGGLQLAGGLRKFETDHGGGTEIEYLGMLLARFGPYGLSVYGGFSRPPGADYLSMFLIGGVNGPIGGVPAFFVTGIGGGFGVNRGLVIPSDMSKFASFPLIQALDSGALADDPFGQIAAMREYFPIQRGTFWFAAGLSFTSFVLVQGIVVVAIEFGNGFELSILGLARMQLPNASLTLVSIELALVARVSSSEGVILVQAQLTDNSWLIDKSVRLTGGFAFATWFAGPNKGQFVLTVGGYHPDFHHDGYPVVPRLGLDWKIGSIIEVVGQSYFALTSEALMAGLRVEITAQLGPAWADIVFGADALIYFDPFWLDATVYASIDAGITIDVWIGEITISVHIGARLQVTGPEFHAVATLEIGPASVTFEIGDEGAHPALLWPQFVAKYLEEAAPGVGRALTAMTGAGTIPPAGGSDGAASAPDGQPDRPFRVVVEFDAVITSTVPLSAADTAVDGAAQVPTASRQLGVPAMQVPQVAPKLTFGIYARTGDGSPSGPDLAGGDGVTGRFDTGDFPVGVWFLEHDATVPSGDLLHAANRLLLSVRGSLPDVTPPEVKYHQVEVNAHRRVLPLLPSVNPGQLSAVRAGAAATANAVAQLRAAHPGVSDTLLAASVLHTRGGLNPLAVDDWMARLAAPVRLGSLGEDLGVLADAAAVVPAAPAAPAAPVFRPPRVRALLAATAASPAVTGVAASPTGTSVSAATIERVLGAGTRLASRRAALPIGFARVGMIPPRVHPRTVADVAATLDGIVPARLVRPAAVAATRTTVVAAPRAASPSGGGVSAGGRLSTADAAERVSEATAQLAGDGLLLDEGAVAVLDLPDGRTDTRAKRPVLRASGLGARVVVLGGGGVLSDTWLRSRTGMPLPVDTRALVVVAQGAPAAAEGFQVAGGWRDSDRLPTAGGAALVAPGCVVGVTGRLATRAADTALAWSTPSVLTGDTLPTTTRFSPAGEGRELLAVAVGLTGTGLDGVAVTFEGADPVGEPAVTTDVSGASVAIVALARSDPAAPLLVHAAAERDRDVTGVTAVTGPAGRANDAAAWLAAAVAAEGFDGLAQPVSAAGIGQTRIRWSAS